MTEEYKFNVIGKRNVIERPDARIKAGGSAIFSADILPPNMLWAKFVRCPHAHARVKSFDTSKAEKLPGVKAILKYTDPEIQAMPIMGDGPEAIDMSIGECHWEGEELGIAIAAESEAICDEAIKLIDVEWEQLPYVLSIEDAIAPGAPLVQPKVNPKNNTLLEWTIKEGDVEEGFAEADFVFEDKYSLKPLAHCGAETQSCTAEWQGDRLRIWMNVQIPEFKRMTIAGALGIPFSKIEIITNYKGGSFGQEASLGAACPRVGPYVALLAKKTGRPVKLVYSRREHFYCAEPGMIAEVKVGAKNNGKITAVHLKAWGSGNIGGQAESWGIWGGKLVGLFSLWLREDFNIDHILDESKMVFVNQCPTWWFRCEENENCFIQSSIIDRVAELTELDVEEVVKRNAKNYNASAESVMATAKKAIDWDAKKHAPGVKLLPNGRLHGMGMVWTHEWSSGGGAVCPSALRVESDGSIKMMGDTIDCGQNPHVAYAMIVAEVIGARPTDVYMPVVSSDCGVPMRWPGGSGGMATNAACWKACGEKAKSMILERAAPILEVSPEELDIKDSVIFVKKNEEKSIPIASVGDFDVLLNRAPPEGGFGAPWGPPPIWHYDPEETPSLFQTCICEVEIDTETGQIETTNIVNVCDVGQAIRPESVEAQMYGGTIMAWGRPFSEELFHDPETGVLLNGNLYDFKYATMLDCGPIDTIYEESHLGYGAWGLTGVGEDTATSMPACFTNAVANALGVRIQENPITPEKVLKALGKL